MLDYLLGTHHKQEPIAKSAHAQNFHISKMSVSKNPSNISSPEDTYQTFPERLYDVIQIPESMLLYPNRALKCLKLQTKPKGRSGYSDIIKCDHIVSISYDKEDGLL